MAHQRQLSPTVFFRYKDEIIYHPMLILGRREQENYFFKAENFGKLRYNKTSSRCRGFKIPDVLFRFLF